MRPPGSLLAGASVLALGVLCGVPVAAAAAKPVTVALVVDTSGRVGRAERATWQRLGRDFVKGLPPGSQVAVFAFDDKPRMVLARTRELEPVVGILGKLRHRGNRAALYDAVYDASRYLGRSGASRRAIVLVTDGLEDNGALTFDDAVRMAQEQRVSVSALGTGAVQERRLRRMAKLTDGEYFPPRTRGSRLASGVAAAALESASRTRPEPEAQEGDAATAPASPSPTPPPAPPTGALEAPVTAAAPREDLSRSLLWAGVAVLALAGLGAVAAALWMRRRGEHLHDAPADAAAPAELAPAGSQTMITRFEGIESVGSQTLVLTLRPLLHVTRGPMQGRMFEVGADRATSIGRAAGNDVVVEDHAVSSQHCRIRPADEGGFELIDLESTNGTFVNERRAGRQPLAAGDLIKVGQTVLQFRMDHLKG